MWSGQTQRAETQHSEGQPSYIAVDSNSECRAPLLLSFRAMAAQLR